MRRGRPRRPTRARWQRFEGLERYWNNANTETLPYLPWNHMDDAGQPIPEPKKVAAPVTHSAAMEGMKVAQMELMMASGQYQSQFGENENAKSGIAIQTRQRQGDNATYHYIDHLAQAIEFTGRQLIDLIPKIYDTKRVIKIMAEDGSQTEVNIDPDGPAYEQRVNGQPASEEQVKQAQADPALKDTIETIFNPNIGKYDVEADIGPAFATRRQEAFAAMTDIAKQNPEFMKIGGDLYFRQADFPLADELADRFKRSIPPAILGEAPRLPCNSSPDAGRATGVAEGHRPAHAGVGRQGPRGAGPGLEAGDRELQSRDGALCGIRHDRSRRNETRGAGAVGPASRHAGGARHGGARRGRAGHASRPTPGQRSEANNHPPASAGFFMSRTHANR